MSHYQQNIKPRSTSQNDSDFKRLTGYIGLTMILQLIFINVFSLIAVFFSSFLEVFLTDNVAYAFGEILYMIAYLLSFLLPAKILSQILNRNKLYQPTLTFGQVPLVSPMIIAAAIALNFAAAYLNSMLVSYMVPFSNVNLNAAEPIDSVTQIILMCLSTAVVPAICEEILFRGVILTNLMPYGRSTAIIGSALLFGLMHGNIFQFLYTTLMGIVLGCVYARTKSIYNVMLIHFFNNLISVVQEILMYHPDYEMGSRVVSIIEAAVMLIGTMSVIFLLLFYFKRKKAEDHGSFGRILEPSMDYEKIPLTPEKKMKNFFSPGMITFIVISSGYMLLTSLLLILSEVLNNI